MGKANALGYARESAMIIVTARKAKVLDGLIGELRAAGSADALGLRCDIGDASEIASVFAAIDYRFGTLNTLINMA